MYHGTMRGGGLGEPKMKGWEVFWSPLEGDELPSPLSGSAVVCVLHVVWSWSGTGLCLPWGGKGREVSQAGSSDGSVQRLRLAAAITKAIGSSSVAGPLLRIWATCLPVGGTARSFSWLLRRAKGDRKPDGETGIPILNTFLVFDTEFLQLESQIIKKILEEEVVTVSVYGFFLSSQRLRCTDISLISFLVE